MILACRFNLGGEFRRSQFADNPGGDARRQVAGGNLDARCDKAHRRHDRGFSDHGMIHDHRIHTDHRVSFDSRTMEYGAMTNMPVGPDNKVSTRQAVQGAIILNVAALLQEDSTEIAAQRRAWRHVAARTYHYVADDNRVWMHKCGRIDNWANPVDGIDPRSW
jgi:hypothetical protein